MNWQPIETAPKDGTNILVYDPPSEYYSGGIFIVFWDREYKRSSKTWCVICSEDGETGSWATISHPTHWMPLPEPPNSAEEQIIK